MNKFLIIFLVSLFKQAFGSFPFDLSRISESNENFPNILVKSPEEHSNRRIGAFPPNYNKDILESTVPAPILTISTVVPSSELKQDSITINITDTPTAKRRRTGHGKSITPDMSIDEIIEMEVEKSRFNSEERRAQFHIALLLIAQNDKAAFDANEENFVAAFGYCYSSFKRDNGSFYLLRYMIMFGADKLIERRCRKPIPISDESHRITEALNYLLKTKPFGVVMEIFEHNITFEIEKETQEKMIKMIKDQYPDLPYFKNLFVESIHKPFLSEFMNIYREDDERTAFNLIPKLYRNDFWIAYKSYYSGLQFHKTALHFPQYYLELDDASKYVFIIICLRSDDAETFEKLIELDPNMLLYVKQFVSEIWEAETQVPIHSNVFHEAIYRSATNCIRFLIEIAPELLSASTATMSPALKYAFEKNEVEIYEILLDLGYNRTFLFYNTNGDEEYNMIQFAYKSRSLKALKFFVFKLGPETVKTEIKKIWKASQIISLSYSLESSEFVENFTSFIFNLFDIKRRSG